MCEAVDDLSVDCEQCGKRTHMFWQNPVGKFIISSSQDNLQIRFMLFHTTLVDSTQFFLRKSFELTRKEYYTISLTRTRIWIMWALIPNRNNMGQALSGDERAQC